MTRFNSIQVAANFDQSLSDSDNIEGFTPNIGSPKTIHIHGIGDLYCYLDAFPEYSEGQSRLDFSTAQSFAGFQMVAYNQARMHRDTLAWLKTNYRGAVSVNLTLDGTTYSDWNAYLRFETSDKVEGMHWFIDVKWIFQLIEEIA